MTTNTNFASPIEIRRATPDDYEAVADFTSDIWPDRGGDYIPRVYHDWLEDGPGQGKKTFLAEVDGEAAGIVQAVMLSPDEAWFQGMRVAAEYRRQGVSRRLNEASFEWAREQGATVGRVMVFSWNAASLGAARTSGFEPTTEFRFATPDPDRDAELPDEYAVSTDPATAWRYWTHSDARSHLCGLGLAPEETWAMRELTRADFEWAADETAVLALESGNGPAGTAVRIRTVERTIDDVVGDGRTETRAEYAVSAWDDLEAARALFAAIARDAAEIGADGTRILLPETARFVTDAAATGAELADEPDIVLSIDLAS